MALHVMLQWGSIGLYVALVACWRLWGLCGARMFDCVAAICDIAMGQSINQSNQRMGTAEAVAAQHDHFNQVQIACIAGHIHG